MPDIQYISNQHIDKEKWDQCIAQSPNGLIYAYSWYLDAMAEQWDALVLNDYETVMPLTWNKKYGICYLYQPYFCASLGIFSKQPVTESIVENFLQSIPKRFRYWDFYLNQQNLFSIHEYPMTERVNYILSLNQDYEIIFSGYRTNLKRNIKKAEDNNLLVKSGISADDIIELALQTMIRISDIKPEHFHRFKKVIGAASLYQKVETIGIYSNNNDLLASAVFLFSNNRWYYILVGNHPNGKTLGASHYLIDRFIQLHAGENTVLDFEGSDIRNLAFFYSSYGAVTETYPAIRMNRLPVYLKWLKQ